jgi:isocitrate dehydrogenase (NAD+)
VKAQLIRDAVADVVAEGRVRTYDMLRMTGGPQVIERGAATTQQMTDAILAALTKRMQSAGEPAMAAQ